MRHSGQTRGPRPYTPESEDDDSFVSAIFCSQRRFGQKERIGQEEPSPGVAISIALVPPLCVVGISLSGGQWTDAWGALLLFLTNFLSILLAGGAVFALLGLGAAATEGESHLNKRRAYRIIALGVVLVAIPLSMASARVFRDSIAQTKITNITSQWVGQYGTDVVVRSVLVSGGTVKILIAGPEQPPTIDDLGAQIRAEIEHVAKVDLRYVPSQDCRYPGAQPR